MLIFLALLTTAAAFGGAGVRGDPYKRGTLVLVGGGFAVRVVSVDKNAWPSLRRENTGNRAPGDGRSDVLVTMRATNRAKLAGIPFVDGTLGAIGATGAPYSSLTGSCGTVPADVSTVSPIPAGKSATVRTCWQVVKLDARTLVMYYGPYDGTRKTYFALR